MPGSCYHSIGVPSNTKLQKFEKLPDGKEPNGSLDSLCSA